MIVYIWLHLHQGRIRPIIKKFGPMADAQEPKRVYNQTRGITKREADPDYYNCVEHIRLDNLHPQG